MPSEDARLPRETYQYLLAKGGNNHLGLLHGEVALFRRRNMWNLYRDFVFFIFGCGVTFVSAVVLLWLGNR
jgi:hypothetical protein